MVTILLDFKEEAVVLIIITQEGTYTTKNQRGGLHTDHGRAGRYLNSQTSKKKTSRYLFLFVRQSYDMTGGKKTSTHVSCLS